MGKKSLMETFATGVAKMGMKIGEGAGKTSKKLSETTVKMLPRRR